MRLEFYGPTMMSGNATLMKVTCKGALYGINRIIPPDLENMRPAIEREMFLQMMGELYDKEIKT